MKEHLSDREKIAAFKYTFLNGNSISKIDSKELSMAIDGINELILEILYEIKEEDLEKEELESLKNEIKKKHKGVEIVVQKGSIELFVLTETIWDIFNENAGGIIASKLLYDSISVIFKKYKRKESNETLLDYERNKEQICEFVTKKLVKKNKEIKNVITKNNKKSNFISFNKIVAPINANINFGFQVFKKGEIISKNEITNKDKHLFDFSRKEINILPEFKHNQKITLKGKISQGNEKNEFYLKCNDWQIKCTSKEDFKSISFKNAEIKGTFYREQNKKPQIKNASIKYIDKKESRSLFDNIN